MTFVYPAIMQDLFCCEKIMAIIDGVGVPIPLDHPAFLSDSKLAKMVKRVESLIELKHDMKDASNAMSILARIFERETQSQLMALLNCIPWTISESLLSYVIVLYSKAFTNNSKRTTLNNKVEEIFRENANKHEYVIDLRHKFYAHHSIEANRHQLFYLPNCPSLGEVKLVPNGQTARLLMSGSIDLEIIEFCIDEIKKYLSQEIENLCRNIIKSLSTTQLEVMNSTVKEELFEKHWRLNSKNRVSPFDER